MDQNTQEPQGDNVNPVAPPIPEAPVAVPPQIPNTPVQEPVPPITPPIQPVMPPPPVDQPPAPAPVNPVSPEVPKKKSSPLFVIALILLLIIILGLGGYFVWTKYLNKTQATPTPSPIAEVVPTPTPDPTADWKTYSNKLFSFKYPSTWDTYLMGENVETALMVAPKEKVDEVKQVEAMGGGSFLTLIINTSAKEPVYKSDIYQDVNSNPITVGGVEGTNYNTDVIQDMQGFSKGDKITTAVVKIDNTYVSIGLLDQTYKEIYDQILSTFKFTEATSSATP